MSIRSNVPEIYLQNYTSVDTVYIECVGNVATAKETAREEGEGEGGEEISWLHCDFAARRRKARRRLHVRFHARSPHATLGPNSI